MKTQTKKSVLMRTLILAALDERGVKVREGSVPEHYPRAPEGFDEGGVFYTAEDGELVRLGRSFNAALEEAKSGNKSWGGIVGTRANKTSKTATGNTASMTTGQKVGNVLAQILAPPLLGGTVGAVEDAGYGKTALLTKLGLVAAGGAAQLSDNPVLNNIGVMGVTCVGYDLGRKYIAPYASMLLPRGKADTQAEDAELARMHQTTRQPALVHPDGTLDPAITEAIETQMESILGPLLTQQAALLEELRQSQPAPEVDRVTLPVPDADTQNLEELPDLSQLALQPEPEMVEVPQNTQPNGAHTGLTV